MVHDPRPALTAAIRSGANRRGALAALLGAMQADAARSQRHGKRTVQSEGKKKKGQSPACQDRRELRDRREARSQRVSVAWKDRRRSPPRSLSARTNVSSTP